MKDFLLRDGTPVHFRRMELMGIVNVTEDSFFSGSRTPGAEEALKRADQLIADGAAIIDVGGESTRPGSAPVTGEEEIRRVCPVIAGIKEKHPDILVSCDTYRAATARAAVEAGADIINDISGLTFDPDMAAVCAELKVPVITMHTGGRPDTMQKDPHYDNVVEEVHDYLERQIGVAVAAGIPLDRIIIDLGIGFGKTWDHNLALLRSIDRFSDLECPQLLAVSRKTFIGQQLVWEQGMGGADGSADASLIPPAGRLSGTVGVSVYAAQHGIEMARVHDVRENAEAVRMYEALQPVSAVVALGSNMGDRKDYLDRAIRMMNERCGSVTAQSKVIETKAYGYTEQDDFLNMAVELKTMLPPRELLRALNGIEAELGRVRTLRWGPRTIDLDIIYYGDRIIDDDDFHVPHADMYNRDFVLEPVCELDPLRVDPRKGVTVKQLLSQWRDREGN